MDIELGGCQGRTFDHNSGTIFSNSPYNHMSHKKDKKMYF